MKLYVMQGDQTLCRVVYDSFGGSALLWVTEECARYKVKRGIVSSTRGDVRDVVGMLREVVSDVLLFEATTPVPIAVSYATPQTLGRDRLAAAVGAWSVYGEDVDTVLIVDLGSAITIDLVTRGGGFEGGVISPGIAMRFRALHEFTASLPLCEPTDEFVAIPRTTREAIEQGVMEGVALEIDGHIDRIRGKSEKKLVIFAGGDAKKLAKRIKNTIFAECELVSLGLNRILEYNAK